MTVTLYVVISSVFVGKSWIINCIKPWMRQQLSQVKPRCLVFPLLTPNEVSFIIVNSDEMHVQELRDWLFIRIRLKKPDCQLCLFTWASADFFFFFFTRSVDSIGGTVRENLTDAVKYQNPGIRFCART